MQMHISSPSERAAGAGGGCRAASGTGQLFYE